MLWSSMAIVVKVARVAIQSDGSGNRAGKTKVLGRSCLVYRLFGGRGCLLYSLSASAEEEKGRFMGGRGAACVLWRHRASGARTNPRKGQSRGILGGFLGRGNEGPLLLNNYNQRTCLCLPCRRRPMFPDRNCCLSYAAAPPFGRLSTLPNSSSVVHPEC